MVSENGRDAALHIFGLLIFLSVSVMRVTWPTDKTYDGVCKRETGFCAGLSVSIMLVP